MTADLSAFANRHIGPSAEDQQAMLATLGPECSSPDEVVDLIARGQGVFAIALGRVWHEVAGELEELPAVRAEDGLVAAGSDELATRRAARKTG